MSWMKAHEFCASLALPKETSFAEADKLMEVAGEMVCDMDKSNIHF